MPYILVDQVETEFDRLVNEIIFEPFAHSDWAAHIVPVIKPDSSIRNKTWFKACVSAIGFKPRKLFSSHYIVDKGGHIVYQRGEMQTLYNVIKCFLVNFRGCQLKKGIWNCYLKLSPT